MNRVLWIWIPDWPLQRLAAARPELSRRRVVLYELHSRGGLRVVAGGADCGIRPGMPLAEATALAEMPRAKNGTPERIPSPSPNPSPLLLEAHDPVADRAALLELALWCERFSPAVAIESTERPDGLALDVTGLGPLFGGEAALAERVVRAFHQRGLSIRVAIADTLGAAWAAAHSEQWQVASDKWQVTSSDGWPGLDRREAPVGGVLLPLPSIIPPGAALCTLAQLPVVALRLPEETVALLAAVGIRSIEQLVALPRASLSTRFGPQLLEHLDWATGQSNELLVPHRADAQFAAEWAFETPVDSAEAIQQVLEELIRRISKLLAARDEGALGFVCRIDCADRERISLSIGLFRPSDSTKHLWELLQLRLETIRLEAPVVALGVEVTAVAPLPHQQQELFAADRGRDAPRQLAALVERLSSRLGREAVVRPCLLPDAQPEYASVDLPWTGGQEERRVAGAKPPRRAPAALRLGHASLCPSHPSPVRKPTRDTKSRAAPPGLRPIWLADPPAPLSVISVIPAGPPAQFHLDGVDYRIARSWGPERIETGWWRGSGLGARDSGLGRASVRSIKSRIPSPEPRTSPPAAGVRRDYYRVETTGGQRFWLFRRLSDARWFLHGEFG